MELAETAIPEAPFVAFHDRLPTSVRLVSRGSEAANSSVRGEHHRRGSIDVPHIIGMHADKGVDPFVTEQRNGRYRPHGKTSRRELADAFSCASERREPTDRVVGTQTTPAQHHRVIRAVCGR